MSTIAIYVFCFMVIASLLGFLASWAWKQPKINDLKSNLDAVKKDLIFAKKQQESLQSHANGLEEEKQKLVYENESLTLKLGALLGKNNTAKSGESFIENDGYVDTSHLDHKINDLNAQIDKLNAEIDIIKRESLEWQVQYSEILKEKEELAIQLNAKRNTKS